MCTAVNRSFFVRRICTKSRLDPSRQLFGVSGRSWELQNRILSASGELLDAANDLGSVFERFWRPKWSSWEALGSFKIDLERVLGDFGRVKAILDRFWSDFGSQNGGQNLFQGTTNESENRIRFKRALKQQKLILNDPPMKMQRFLEVTSCQKCVAEVLGLVKVAKCR